MRQFCLEAAQNSRDTGLTCRPGDGWLTLYDTYEMLGKYCYMACVTGFTDQVSLTAGL